MEDNIARHAKTGIDQFGLDDPSFMEDIQRSDKSSKGASNGVVVFVVSLILFATTGLFSWKPSQIIAILVILLIHEFGHFLSMKASGYSNVKIFFLPFLGAAVSGRVMKPHATKQALVSLAGPFPGLIIGVVFAVAYARTQVPSYLYISSLFLWINAFNLLPLYPLDGGHFFESTLFSRNPFVETAFRILTIIALGILAIWLQFWALLIVCVFLLLSIHSEYTISNMAHRLKKSGIHLPFNRLSFDYIREELRPKLIGPSTTVQAKNSILYRIWLKANMRPPKVLATVLLLVVYVFGAALSGVGATVLIIGKARENMHYEISVDTSADGGREYFELQYNHGSLTGKVFIDSLYRYHGYTESYFSSGRQSNTGSFHHGKMDSTWIHFNENGDTTLIQHFAKGRFLDEVKNVDNQWRARTYDELSAMEKITYNLHTKGKAEYVKAPRIPLNDTRTVEEILGGQ